MTREEFNNEITSWGALYDFMREIDYERDEVSFLDADGYDSYVEYDINDRDGFSWTEIRDYLNDLPMWTEGTIYMRNGWFDYCIVSEDSLNAWKSEVYEYAVDYGYFDDQAEEVCCPDEDEPEEEFIEVEDADLMTFMVSCEETASVIKPINNDDEIEHLIF